jgi:hypothetical protein
MFSSTFLNVVSSEYPSRITESMLSSPRSILSAWPGDPAPHTVSDSSSEVGSIDDGISSDWLSINLFARFLALLSRVILAVGNPRGLHRESATQLPLSTYQSIVSTPPSHAHQTRAPPPLRYHAGILNGLPSFTLHCRDYTRTSIDKVWMYLHPHRGPCTGDPASSPATHTPERHTGCRDRPMPLLLAIFTVLTYV